MGVYAHLAPHQRAAIELEIESHLACVDLLIAQLDDVDEPFMDIEEDDPSGDPLEMTGEASSDDGREMLIIPPAYGIDQTTGPINEREAHRARYMAEMESSATITGGWQFQGRAR